LKKIKWENKIERQEKYINVHFNEREIKIKLNLLLSYELMTLGKVNYWKKWSIKNWFWVKTFQDKEVLTILKEKG
jgi:hypothetical protein